jgi:hypothetical protein
MNLSLLEFRILSRFVQPISTSYREKARWFQEVIAKTRGLDLTADIIESVFGERVEDQQAEVTTSFSSRDTNR